MKKDLTIIFLISLIALVFWRSAFFNFFAQDDFILIPQFSQNNLLSDLKNVFGKPEVTHWRPMHNFYFFIAGNLFGKAYYFYHALTLFLHIGTSFLIYKILIKLRRNFNMALIASLIYTIHPAHFVSIYWISGSAVNIGFFFLLLSFYVYLNKHKFISLLLYIFALLGSEAMIAGIALFISSSFLSKKEKFDAKFLIAITGSIIAFLAIKFAYTNPETLEIYKPEISAKVPFAIYYYILRILGFAETSGDLFISILLLIFLVLVIGRNLIQILQDQKKLILPLASLSGLFPFILLPTHLSPHYMVLPIFGFCQILALALSKFSKKLAISGLLIFALISFINIEITQKNNWVVKRSNLAKSYLQDLGNKNLASGSTIVINSKELYIALGQGTAIDFWFNKKNYKICVTSPEDCEKNVKTSGESKIAIGE